MSATALIPTTPHVPSILGASQLLRVTLMLIDLLDQHCPNLERLLAVDLMTSLPSVPLNLVRDLAAMALGDAQHLNRPEVRPLAQQVQQALHLVQPEPAYIPRARA